MKLVGSECANSTAGGCRGIALDSTWAKALPKCLVRLGLPCVHFERRLLPLALRRAEYAGVPLEYANRTGGNFERRLRQLPEEEGRLYGLHPFCQHSPSYVRPEVKANRWCECGAALAKGHRFCPECREKRAKAATRERVRRHRQKHDTLV